MKQRRLVLSLVLFAAVAFVLPTAWRVFAQSNNQVLGIGGQSATGFATSVSQCPTVTSGYFICVVVPGGTVQPFIVLSVAGYQNGAPFQAAMAAPSVVVGSTTTLAAGAQATVNNSGTGQNAVLNFGIPAGANGATGSQGGQGIPGPVQSFTKLTCPTFNVSVAGLSCSGATEQ